jgi:hypothetical protein
MRQNRKLEEVCWYDVDARVNNGEKLFGVRENVKRFEQVVNEAHFLFAFELRGLKFNDTKVLFFIKPDDGLKLPEIMQWIKQTFAGRFNRDHGRTGHIGGAHGRTRNVERVVVPWQHGGPLILVLQRIRLTGPTDTSRRYSTASRRPMRSGTCSTRRFTAKTAGRVGRRGRLVWWEAANVFALYAYGVKFKTVLRFFSILVMIDKATSSRWRADIINRESISKLRF